ncbi:unnamed protein product [Sphagnum tenellum]
MLSVLLLLVSSLPLVLGEQPVDSDRFAIALEKQGKALTSSLDKLSEAMGQQQRCAAGVNTDILENLTQHLRGSINLENKLQDLQSTVNSLQEKVASLEGKGSDYRGEENAVFFSAFSRKRFACYGCILSFESINVDSHNALDSTSGKFVCPKSGHYFLQFHALAESGSEVQVEMLVNGAEVIHLYDRDIGGSNNRYAMIGQSFIHTLRQGDEVCVRLHKGAIKGGGDTTFTSFLGMMISPAKENEI